jgi:cysteine desulfurase
MRDRLESGLREKAAASRVNGHPARCLPNTLSVSFEGLVATTLLAAIEETVAASAGAACHSGQVQVSHVLRAMHVPEVWAGGTLRFSTGRMTTEAEIDAAVSVVSSAVDALKQDVE